MSKAIVICGHGPGISPAVAQRFGREGFQVALIARSASPPERLRCATVADTFYGLYASRSELSRNAR